MCGGALHLPSPTQPDLVRRPDPVSVSVFVRSLPPVYATVPPRTATVFTMPSLARLRRAASRFIRLSHPSRDTELAANLIHAIDLIRATTLCTAAAATLAPATEKLSTFTTLLHSLHESQRSLKDLLYNDDSQQKLKDINDNAPVSFLTLEPKLHEALSPVSCQIRHNTKVPAILYNPRTSPSESYSNLVSQRA